MSRSFFIVKMSILFLDAADAETEERIGLVVRCERTVGFETGGGKSHECGFALQNYNTSIFR